MLAPDNCSLYDTSATFHACSFQFSIGPFIRRHKILYFLKDSPRCPYVGIGHAVSDFFILKHYGNYTLLLGVILVCIENGHCRMSSQVSYAASDQCVTHISQHWTILWRCLLKYLLFSLYLFVYGKNLCGLPADILADMRVILTHFYEQ